MCTVSLSLNFNLAIFDIVVASMVFGPTFAGDIVAVGIVAVRVETVGAIVSGLRVDSGSNAVAGDNIADTLESY